MSQITLLRSSGAGLEAFQASTLGVPMKQFRRNMIGIRWAKSTKKTSPTHSQSAIQISVVIPTYCRPHLLRNCIQCLVDQSFDKSFYEVIVVSDGCDDESRNVVNSFKQFHPLHLPEKKGPAAARNLGWQRAWGKMIAFTDDDCLPERTWLAYLYKTYRGESVIAYAGKVKVPLPSHSSDYAKTRQISKVQNLSLPIVVVRNLHWKESRALMNDSLWRGARTVTLNSSCLSKTYRWSKLKRQLLFIR
jgi:glycosyltransferase involved in cell wall biosynthesis